MQNSFIQSQNGKLIIDQAQLSTIAAIVLIVVVLLVIVAVAIKRRKKDFIKTLPTNLKDGE